MRTPKNTHTTTVTGLTHECRGVARIEGKTTFLHGALPDEEVTFYYTRRKSSFDEGDVVEVLKANPSRISPGCQHFGQCGGCQLQYINKQDQIELKQHNLLELLSHHAIMPKIIAPPLGGPEWKYRRKARLSVKFLVKKNKVLVGFREKRSHFVADITRCEILCAPFDGLIAKLGALFQTLHIKSHIPQIEIAAGDDSAAMIIRHLVSLPDDDRKKLREFCTAHAIKLFLQPGGLETIHLDWPKNASPLLSYSLVEHGLQLHFLPHQFIQINAEVNQRMIHQAIEWLNPVSSDRLLDLFCGIGNFSLPFAKFCEKVVGVEGDRSAVNQAIFNARIHSIVNVDFFHEDLSKIPNSPWSLSAFHKIILDPPRTGAFELIPWIAQSKARVLYISCNTATFARDTKVLIEKGYVLEKLGLVDMFPHTQHAEVMALFERGDRAS